MLFVRSEGTAHSEADGVARGEHRNGSDAKARALRERRSRRLGAHERRFGEHQKAPDLTDRRDASKDSAHGRERGRAIGLAARTPGVRNRHPRARDWNQETLVSGRLLPSVRLRYRCRVPTGEERAACERQTPARSSGRILLGRWSGWNQWTTIRRSRWRQLRARRAPREQRHGDDQQRPEASHRGLFARVGSERKHNARGRPGRLTKTARILQVLA